jgi:hypothetical protein
MGEGRASITGIKLQRNRFSPHKVAEKNTEYICNPEASTNFLDRTQKT